MDDLNNLNNAQKKDNDDFLEIDKLDSLQKKLTEEKDVDENGRLVRIEALLHALIATLKKLIDEPDPLEPKIVDINDRLDEIVSQNKILAKTLLLVVNKLKELEKTTPKTSNNVSSNNNPSGMAGNNMMNNPMPSNLNINGNMGGFSKGNNQNNAKKGFPNLPPLPPKK